MKINKTFFRYLAYTLMLIILYVLEATPNLLPVIFGSKPMLLIPLALSISAREDYVASIVFSALCGIFIDISSIGAVGYFAIALTLSGYIQTDIFKKYIIPSFFSSTIYSVISISVVICLYFLLFKVMLGIDGCSALFVNHYISRIVYTVLCFVPIYFINGFLFKRLQ